MSDENSLKTTGHANKTISARDNKRFTEYFVNMVTKLSSSDNNYDFISSDDDYYVSVPTNIDIDIVVKNKEITEIYETQNGLYCKDNKIEKYRKTRFLDKFNEIINDNTETKLLFKPLWRDGRKIRFKTLSVIDAVCANQFCIAEGAPGSGKSTMIRHITSSLVQQYRKKECLLSNDTLSSLFKDNAFLPMYLPINNICDLDGDNINLNNVLEKTYGLKEAELQAGELKDFIINENIIYLIDCADEVVDESKFAEIKTFINSIKNNNKNGGFSNNRFVIVCGIGKMQAMTNMDFFKFELKAMTAECREQLVDKTFGYDYEKAKKFKKVLSDGCIDETIIGNPRLFCFLLYTYKNEDKILSNKSCIARECIEFLLKTSLKNSRTPVDQLISSFKDGNLGIEKNSFLNVVRRYVTDSMYLRFMNILQTLAYDTVFNSEKAIKTVFTYGDIVDVVNSIDGNGKNFGENELAVVNQAGILRLVSDDNVPKYKFACNYFQEYLSAVKLAEKGDEIFNTIEKELDNLGEKYKIIVLMLVEIWHDANPVTWSCLVWWLLGCLVSYTKRTKESYENRDVIASLCADIISCRDYKIIKDMSKIENNFAIDILYQCNSLMMDILSDNDTDLKIKIQCARCLWTIGQNIPNNTNIDRVKLGDCRRGVGVCKDNLDKPDIAWCCIKGGTFALGLESKDKKLLSEYDDGDFARELPIVENITVSDFYMSKYPITMDQYRLFVDDGAYDSSDFWEWSDVSKKWFDDFRNQYSGDELKSYIADMFNNVGNAPMVNISWIEAKTYCEWLSRKLGVEIRLPYETEWEYVAKLLGNKMYAYSNDYNNRYYIGRNIGLKKAAPVGLTEIPKDIVGTSFDEFPMDLNGNVWEWTQTIMSRSETLENYSKMRDKIELKRDNYKLLKDNVMMVVRGGSYLNGALQLRNSYRGRDQIIAHILFRQGFRIVQECSAKKENNNE